MAYTYEQIKPLIKGESLNGIQLNVTFQVSDKDQPIQAIGIMMAEQQDIMKNVGKQAVKQTIVSSILGVVGSFFGRAVGGGVAGSAVRSATHSVGSSVVNKGNSMETIMQVKDTPENREKAILKAFESVSTFFEYDERTNVWTSKLHSTS
jgi:hypothetical protein